MPAALAGREVLLGVRPEHVEPCAESEAMIIADIDLIEPLGADTLVYGHLGGGSDGGSNGGSGARIAARLQESVDARTGRLALRFDPARAHFFDPASGGRIDAA
jgi:sn-glycerol 3-phosphate transport system ATP-binding protein